MVIILNGGDRSCSARKGAEIFSSLNLSDANGGVCVGSSPDLEVIT